MLVEFIVVAKTHDVLQQTSLLYLRPAIADADTAPVRLTRYQAIAFQQVAVKRLGHWCFVGSSTEQFRRRLVMAAVQIQSIQTQPVHFSNFFFGVLLGGH